MHSVKLPSGMKIGRLIYGTEPFAIKKGPDNNRTQGDIKPKEGGKRLFEAFKLGVNLWDTSDDYGTHPHVAEGLKLVPRNKVAVADKTNAATKEEADIAINYSLKSLGTDYVDIMFLHNVPFTPIDRKDTSGRPYTSQNLTGRMPALKKFHEAKNTGTIKTTGLTTHNTKVLRQAKDIPEIDVVCTTLNMISAYIEGGTLEEHLEAIKALHDNGKFTYVIKILHAGRLKNKAEESIRYALRYHDFIDAWNIGMYDINDVRGNIKIMEEILG